MAKKLTKAQKKRKRWIGIIAPKEFDHMVLGETLAYEPANIIGRTLQMNLMALTGDPKKQNVALHFKVSSARENQAVAETYKYEVMQTHLKRMTRKERTKVEDSFVCETKDKVKVVVKPIVFARSKVRHSVETAIRKHVRAFLEEAIKEQDYTSLFHLLISTKLQKETREKVNKVYPLAGCEVRVLERMAA